MEAVGSHGSGSSSVSASPSLRPCYIANLPVEGIITVVFGLSIPLLLPDDFESARYLTHADKELMRLRQRVESIYVGNQHFEWSKVRAAYSDYKLWINCFAQFGSNVL